MKILLAKSAGFCYGVANAMLQTAELVAENSIKPENSPGKKVIRTLGAIIHNETIINQLAKRGVTIIDTPEEANEGEVVIIRAHGVGEDIYRVLKQRKAQISDVTCLYVKKIHELVKQKSKEGYVIVVVGDQNHPEVIGICGWIDGPKWVVMSPEELLNPQLDKDYQSSKGLCFVSQTTLTMEKGQKVFDFAKKKFENVIKFDTICKATLKRQSEAIELAKQVDAMVVIGSRSSSNTLKLVEVCSGICDKTYLIEGAQDLVAEQFKYINTIGITAGASTPDKVIEEVISKMSEMNQNTTGETFEELLDQYSGEIRSGKIMKGTVSRITTDKIYVDLGGKFEGELPATQFDGEEVPAIGTVIDVRVNRVSEKDNAIHLSKGVDRFTKMLKEFTELMEAGETIDAKIDKAVKGGAIAKTKIGDVFIPLPLLADKYVEKADDYVGQSVKIKIISVDEKRRSVKASAKEHAMAQKTKAEGAIWDKIVVGETITGTVKNFTDYRAFIDLGGIDGSIHISEISWNRIKHPSEALKIGDTAEVKVLDADRDTRRISLTMKKAEENPWFGAEDKFELGAVLKGTVARIVPFGAFVILSTGVDGLVHISQISDFRLAKVEEALKVGDEVECKIIEVDIPTQKISLSIKDVAPINPPARVAEAEARQKERDERDAERAKKNEEREAAQADRVVKKTTRDSERGAREGQASSHVEEMTNSIGNMPGLADMFSEKPTEDEEKEE